MAKKQKQSEDIRFAVNEKALKKAKARAKLEQAEQEKRIENREKSRRMGSLFLLGVVTLIALFCLYTLLRTLLVRRAASLEELRGNLLFVSFASIPVLLAGGAFLVHRLLKTRRERFGERSKRISGLLFALVLLGAFLLFGVQLRGGLQDASAHPAYTETLSALERSGLSVTAPDSVSMVRALLADSLQAELRCGESTLRLNYLAGKLSGVTDRFLDQAAWDYESYPMTEAGAAAIRGPVEADGAARAAVSVRYGEGALIMELKGPASELETLIPLLAACGAGT